MRQARHRSVQHPVRLDRWSEPQPDLAVLRRRPDFYATGERLGLAGVLLLIEVADSSLTFDQDRKIADLCARRHWRVDAVRPTQRPGAGTD
jgi:hypothetical protein